MWTTGEEITCFSTWRDKIWNTTSSVKMQEDETRFHSGIWDVFFHKPNLEASDQYFEEWAGGDAVVSLMFWKLRMKRILEFQSNSSHLWCYTCLSSWLVWKAFCSRPSWLSRDLHVQDVHHSRREHISVLFGFVRLYVLILCACWPFVIKTSFHSTRKIPTHWRNSKG